MSTIIAAERIPQAIAILKIRFHPDFIIAYKNEIGELYQKGYDNHIETQRDALC